MLAECEGLSCGYDRNRNRFNIKVPSRTATLGRMFNVLGEPIDEETK